MIKEFRASRYFEKALLSLYVACCLSVNRKVDVLKKRVQTKIRTFISYLFNKGVQKVLSYNLKMSGILFPLLLIACYSNSLSLSLSYNHLLFLSNPIPLSPSSLHLFSVISLSGRVNVCGIWAHTSNESQQLQLHVQVRNLTRHTHAHTHSEHLSSCWGTAIPELIDDPLIKRDHISYTTVLQIMLIILS